MRWSVTVIDVLRSRDEAGATLSIEPGSSEDKSAREVLALAAGYADEIEMWGVPRGEALPCLVATGPTAEALFLGAVVAGRPLAPLGPKLTAYEIAQCIENLSCKVLLTERRFVDSARKAADHCGVRLIVVDDDPVVGDPDRLAAPSEDAVVLYLHTSGTTGTPKSVPVTDEQLGARTELLGAVCDYGPGDVVVAASPFHHIAGLGMVLVAMARGSVVVALPQFAIKDWHLVRALQPTHLALVATHVEMLVAAGEFDVPSLRAVFYGASLLREETIRRVIDENPQVDFIRWYGQTEASPITWLSPGDHVRAAHGESWLFETVGSPLPGVTVRIDSPDDAGVGEIWAKAAHFSVLNSQGWRETGDLARIGDDGYLRLSGRKGDMIIRGGENVYPIEIEKVIISHPQVVDALVTGVPDDVLGQRIKAAIQVVDPADPPQIDELRRFVRERLAGFKVPAEWEIREGFERNASGKIIRLPAR